MLTTEQIYQNKINFIELLSKLNIDITELSRENPVFACFWGL